MLQNVLYERVLKSCYHDFEIRCNTHNFPNAERASEDFSPDKMIVVLCKDGGFAERPQEKGSIDKFFLVRIKECLSYSLVMR